MCKGLSSVPPGFGTAQYNGAAAQAKAYFAACDAKYSLNVMIPMIWEMTDLADAIVRWQYAQLENGQFKNGSGNEVSDHGEG
jgi:hypothetical protein